MFKKESFITRVTRNRLSFVAALFLAFVLLAFSLYENPFGAGTAGLDTINLIRMWVLSLIGGVLLVAFIQLFAVPELKNYFLERLLAHIMSVSVLYIWVLFVVLMSFPGFTSYPILFFDVILFYTLIGIPVEIIRYIEEKIWEFKQHPPERVLHTLCDLNKDLPVALQESNIWSLTADDHYVHVRTEKGMHMMLMSLSDAILKTTHIEGLRVHRSHWVAKQGIKEIKRKNGRVQCTLHDDTIIPISRSGYSKIKQKEWLK